MTSNIMICALYLVLAIIGMTLIKSGHGTDSFFSIPLINVALSERTIIGILFYGLSFLVFTFYVSKLNIGIVIPVISGLNSVFVVIIGYFVFKEHITFGQVVGITFVIFGTILVGVFK